jgi:hypothetical protein
MMCSLIVNSDLTDPFIYGRGCRQGDSLSAYLFIISMLVFVSYFVNNEYLKSSALVLASSRIPIRCFADDTATTHRSIRSINVTFELFSQFENLSGLALNQRKTLILPLGLNQPPELKKLGCRIESGPVKYLGAWLNCKNEKEEYRLNFEHRVDTYDCLLNRWKLRGLSLIGRNLVVKTLCLSQLTYPLQFLIPADSVLKSYQTTTDSFIWRSPPKVKRAVTSTSFSQGGLKIIDIKLYSASIRLAWLGRYLIDPWSPGWREYFSYLLRPFGGIFFLACDYDMKYFPAPFPFFYKTILNDWFKFPRKPGHLITARQLSQVIIWHNKDLLIGRKPFFFSDWAKAGIYYLGQLFDITGSFISFNTFTSRFGSISGNDWFRLLQIRDCIPSQWRLTFLDQFNQLSEVEFVIPPVPQLFDIRTFSFRNLEGARCNQFYSILSISRYMVPTCQNSWVRDLGIQDVLPYFGLVVKLKLPPYHSSFQWKLLHRLIPTGRYLFLRKLRSTQNCLICNESPDNLEHFFFYCLSCRELWAELEDRLNDHGIQCLIGCNEALLGSLNGGLPLNTILLLTRLYIYKCRINNEFLSFFNLVIFLRSEIRVLRLMHSSQANVFDNVWNQFVFLLNFS